MHDLPEATEAIDPDRGERRAASTQRRHIDALRDLAGRLATVGGWALEVSTQQVSWTDEVFRLHDLAPGAVPDLARAIEFFEPAARPQLDAALQACMRTGQAFELEFPMVSAQGRHIWVSVKGQAEREHGRIVRVVGAVQDITARALAEQALRESEGRYRGLFDNAADAILVIGLDGCIRDANPRACQIYGYAYAELVGLHGSRFVHPDHAFEFAEALASVRAGRPCTVESMDLRKGGEPFPIEVHISPLFYLGEPVMLCSVHDISERRRHETQMREALMVFNASSQAIMTTDADGIILAVNPAFQAITGYAAEEAIGRKPSMLSSGRQDDAHYDAMWQALVRDGAWEGEVWNRRKNGAVYAQWQTISAVRDDQGHAVEYVALFTDITQRKQQEEAVWQQAHFDALTGLANRSLFHDRLERAIAVARRNHTRLGLLFLDLDDFKSINDRCGHDVGDQLLVDVAARLKACVRERDTVARLGGDEFTILIHDVTDLADLRTVAEKAVGVLRDPFTLAGRQHRVTGSAGMTIFPDDGQDLRTLLRNADIAMYKSKQDGRNRFRFYAPQMQADTVARLQLEAELRDAIAERAFVLHYQPIVDADSGELVGAEALLRWQHALRGLIGPESFLGVAEDSALIVQIGEWVLREALPQWRAWQTPGQPVLRLAINLAEAQLRSATLAELLGTLLAETGLDPAGLVLEVDESTPGERGGHAESALPVLQALQALGVSCTLDRFGTGLASLASLKRPGVDRVKIDRSLLAGCPQDRDHAHLVEAIVNMAHSLGRRVAACGVETESQRTFLRDLGCDELQGHLIGAPMPAAPFESLARRHRLRAAADGGSIEQRRLLAALREDEIDVVHWLRRLLGEHSSELAGYLEGRDWTSRGLDLRAAVDAHLRCRRCLSDLVLERSSRPAPSEHCAGPGEPCTLHRWATQFERSGDPRWAGLVQALRHYHRLAGEISADCRQGYRDSARRALLSLKFRTASRDVLLALVDGFKDAGQTAPMPLDE